MPTYIIFDPFSTPVTNVVTQVLRSFNEGNEEVLGPNRVKEPDLSVVDLSKPMRWTGTAVENLTQAEIDSVKDARDAASLADVKQAAKDIFVSPSSAANQAIALGFETIIELTVSEINILRAAVVPPLTARTNAQIKNAFRSTYENKVDNLS